MKEGPDGVAIQNVALRDEEGVGHDHQGGDHGQKTKLVDLSLAERKHLQRHSYVTYRHKPRVLVEYIRRARGEELAHLLLPL